MADITDPQAIRFVNEQIRPLAEKMRNLDAEIDAAVITWFSGINTTIGSSASDDIADGREADGVSRLTAEDVTNLMAVLVAIQSAHDAAGVDATISKPCVRTMTVS